MEHLVASTSDCVDTGLDGGTRDYTNEFKTTKMFGSKEELITWAREVGRSHGFVIITLRSDSGKGRKRPRVTLGCERSGKCDTRSAFKEGLKLNVRHGRSSGTKKCDCCFRLMGNKQAAGNEWELIVVDGTHNHEAGDTGKQGHSFRGRLSQEEDSLLKDMWKTGKKPKEILGALRKRDKDNKSTLRTIYNECQSLERRKKKEDTVSLSSKFLQLMSKASEYNYIEKHRASPENDKVLDFFLTHPCRLKLLLLFPTVLIVYLWDKPDWTVLEISGVTSTDIIFSVAWAIFSSSTSKSSIQWALESFRGVMVDKGIVMPDIVIFQPNETKIDEARTFWKATKDVFHTAKTLFTKQIKYDIFEEVRSKWDSFSRMWKLLEASPRTPTEALERHLMQIRTEYPEAAEYVIDIWFKPYKEMFIPAWTDELMHFGITDEFRPLMIMESMRVQGIFYPLDEYISACAGVVVAEKTVIDTFWKQMRSGIEKEVQHIKISFKESLENEYKDADGPSELKELHGCISIYALELIKKQTLLANEIVDDDHSDSCTCAIKRTHGIPCEHEIAKYKREGRPVPLECIHPHWKKLHLDPLTSDEMNPEYAEDTDDKMNTETHYAAQSLPNAGPPIEPPTQECQPENKVEDIQPTRLEFVDVCPPFLRRYIFGVRDVPRDGHCGFRAIASFMDSEVDGWVKVWKNLKNEVKWYSAHYVQLFGCHQRVNELLHALEYFDSSCPEKEHWMIMPDMGHVIASSYNVVLMHLSSEQCFTFFPRRTVPVSLSKSSPREIAIRFFQEHFVPVHLVEGHPMPSPTPAPTRKNPHASEGSLSCIRRQPKSIPTTTFH